MLVAIAFNARIAEIGIVQAVFLATTAVYTIAIVFFA